MNVLIVCQANACRSKMAEVVLRSKVGHLADIEIGSAALTGGSGRRMWLGAREALIARGYADPGEAAASVALTTAILKWADLTLTMEASQRHDILHDYPMATGRVWRLGHWSDEDIPNPTPDTEACSQTLTRIEHLISNWIPILEDASPVAQEERR